MAGQRVSIEMNWEGSRFHCPACGAEVFNDEGETSNPCSHLLFTWVSEVGDMDYVSPALPEKLRRVASEMDQEDDEDLPNPCDSEFAKHPKPIGIIWSIQCALLSRT